VIKWFAARWLIKTILGSKAPRRGGESETPHQSTAIDSGRLLYEFLLLLGQREKVISYTNRIACYQEKLILFVALAGESREAFN
jgi:hypothetical protein